MAYLMAHAFPRITTKRPFEYFIARECFNFKRMMVNHHTDTYNTIARYFIFLVCCSVRQLTSMARHSGALSKILDDRWRKIREEQRRYVSDRWKCYDGNMVTNNSKILQKSQNEASYRMSF